MTLSQVGMIIELVGFLLLAVMAGILLEGDVLGVLGARIEKAFASISEWLARFRLPLNSPLQS